MTTGFFRSGRIVFVAAVLWVCLVQNLRASSVLIDGDTPRSSIVLAVTDCTLDQIMMALRQKYNFELSGVEYVKTPEVVSLNLSGTLRTVLERLLRNWNHVIVNSADADSGIRKSNHS